MRILSKVPLRALSYRTCIVPCKKHTHAYTNGLIVHLSKLVPEGLDSVTTEHIKEI